MGRVVHRVKCPGASCPWAVMSVGRVVHGVSCPWGELSMGRVVQESCTYTVSRAIWGIPAWVMRNTGRNFTQQFWHRRYMTHDDSDGALCVHCTYLMTHFCASIQPAPVQGVCDWSPMPSIFTGPLVIEYHVFRGDGAFPFCGWLRSFIQSCWWNPWRPRLYGPSYKSSEWTELCRGFFVCILINLLRKPSENCIQLRLLMCFFYSVSAPCLAELPTYVQYINMYWVLCTLMLWCSYSMYSMYRILLWLHCIY